ncbi:hypothetical protein ACBZ90_00060 (plasmid) [Vibrio alginolyticus]
MNEQKNRAFCEQMAAATVELGTQEALSCMARYMRVIAHDQGISLQFECDLGSLEIQPNEILIKH